MDNYYYANRQETIAQTKTGRKTAATVLKHLVTAFAAFHLLSYAFTFIARFEILWSPITWLNLLVDIILVVINYLPQRKRLLPAIMILMGTFSLMSCGIWAFLSQSMPISVLVLIALTGIVLYAGAFTVDRDLALIFQLVPPIIAAILNRAANELFYLKFFRHAHTTDSQIREHMRNPAVDKTEGLLILAIILFILSLYFEKEGSGRIFNMRQHMYDHQKIIPKAKILITVSLVLHLLFLPLLLLLEGVFTDIFDIADGYWYFPSDSILISIGVAVGAVLEAIMLTRLSVQRKYKNCAFTIVGLFAIQFINFFTITEVTGGIGEGLFEMLATLVTYMICGLPSIAFMAVGIIMLNSMKSNQRSRSKVAIVMCLLESALIGLCASISLISSGYNIIYYSAETYYYEINDFLTFIIITASYILLGLSCSAYIYTALPNDALTGVPYSTYVNNPNNYFTQNQNNDYYNNNIR